MIDGEGRSGRRAAILGTYRCWKNCEHPKTKSNKTEQHATLKSSDRDVRRRRTTGTDRSGPRTRRYRKEEPTAHD